MFSKATIPGSPTVLLLALANQSWERDLARRLHATLARRGLALATAEPATAGSAREAASIVATTRYNCLCLLAVDLDAEAAPELARGLAASCAERSMLLTACAFDDASGAVLAALFEASSAFAPIALAPKGPVSEREAGLGLLKFYAELALHTERVDDAAAASITGRMTWFSWAKARALLQRRGFDADWSLRT